MRYSDLFEVTQNYDLLRAANSAVYKVIRKFFDDSIEDFRRQAIYDRREKLGYHRYEDNVPGFQKFDPEEFEEKNKDWDVDSDGLGDNLKNWIPDPTTVQFHIVYKLMGQIDAALTRVTQEYVRKKFGDPVYLYDKKIERKVEKIRVSVWWKPKIEKASYTGSYHASIYHANGEETLLEIVVDRKNWAYMIHKIVSNMISFEKADFDYFLDNIVNTYMHEYAHLEQDIRGKYNKLGLIPGKTGRAISYDKDDYERILGKTNEIDAHASGAVSQTINKIMSKHRIVSYAEDPNHIDDERWNADIYDAMLDHAPAGEYIKYILGMNKKENPMLDPKIKEKFLQKVKKRFVRSYITGLQKYLRPIKKK